MNICESTKAVSAEVGSFIFNVRDVKEESITDYLVWKWRELDKKFSYINVKTFTRHEENLITGADFELKLWLIGPKYHVSLVFQAKKFIKQYDSYINKLNYPNGTRNQMMKLLQYAGNKSAEPFYMFYSTPDAQTKTFCCTHGLMNTSLYMADAYTIRDFANGLYGKKISKNNLLAASIPFHCMFCCLMNKSNRGCRRHLYKHLLLDEYINRSFVRLLFGLERVRRSNEELPDYVNKLLSGRTVEISKEDVLPISQSELGVFRTVGVYDMRDIDGMPEFFL
jgi:hypothetical protein